MSRVTPEMYLNAGAETAYMVGIALAIGALIGIPLALLMVITRPGGLRPQPAIYQVVNVVVNILRSLPFVILMVAIVPLTRLITGTSIGTTAALVPLTIYIAPFVARLIEQSLLEVSPGILEAADSMGGNLVADHPLLHPAGSQGVHHLGAHHRHRGTHLRHGDGRVRRRWRRG